MLRLAGIPRPLRIGLWSFSGLLGVAVLVVGVLVVGFDPNSLKPRITEAVKQSTGRDLVLNGNISLGLSLQPTLIARDAALGVYLDEVGAARIAANLVLDDERAGDRRGIEAPRHLRQLSAFVRSEIA